MSAKPIPSPSYLDECEPLGAINNVKRWRNTKGDRLYTWDSLHGEIEVFDRRGRHLGALNSKGDFIKPAVKGRTLYV